MNLSGQIYYKGRPYQVPPGAVSTIVSLDKSGGEVDMQYINPDGTYTIQADPAGSLVLYLTDPADGKKVLPSTQISVSQVTGSGGSIQVGGGGIGTTLAVAAGLGILGIGLLSVSNTKKPGGLGKMDVDQVARAGFYVVGGVLGYTVVKKVLDVLNITTSKDTKSVLALQSDPASPWNPNYWMQAPGGQYSFAFTESQAADLARQIYGAMGLFHDDVETIFAAIKQCRTKANLSFIAWEFQKLYQADLLNYLRNGGGILPWDGISDSDIVQLNAYIANLPNF